MQNTQSTSSFIQSLGFLSAPFFHESDSIDQVIETCLDQDIKRQLDNMDIEFDGLVIKIKNNQIRELLGNTNHHPRRAIAYKYPAKQVSSKITSIERQVGRTGILTPVASIEPVSLSGATISKVTLHNPDFIRDKDIRINDTVMIQRSGEVIPYIVCTIPELRDGTQIIVQKPENCPVCNDPIHTDIATSGNTSYYCINAICPASTKEKIKHFVSRDAMNIEGIGDAIIEQMVDNQIISNYADLYKLPRPEVRMVVKNLPGMGDKKIDLIIKGLELSKSKELAKIINALGIPQVGEKTARVISDHIKEIQSSKLKIKNSGQIETSNDPSIINFESLIFNYKDLINYLSDQSFLEEIHSIGPETISTITDWVHHQTNIHLLEQLENYGVKFDNFGSEPLRESNKLQYLRFAISGTFELSRDQIISHLVKQGATYCPNITKNTNMLIIGNSPSSKVTKAAKQGIETIEGLRELEKKVDINFGLNNIGLF